MDRSFDPSTKVGDVVATHPRLARVFERIGIDFCCGGKRTIAQACAARGLDPQTVVVMLDAAAELPVASAAAQVETTGMGLAQLADHVVATHHAYLKEELPALLEKADRVATKHSWRDPRLTEVAATVHAFAVDMFDHMEKEEQILFPLIRGLGTQSAPAHSVAGPIRQMEAEHDSAGQAVARLRELTGGFTPDADSCNTHRALLAGLAHLEEDLHVHVHKENNVLFPRAIALEEELAGAAP